MQKLLTIVIPVYKVEPYIKKCLDSLLIYRQNTHELDDTLMSLMDILIINDGTPDKSAEMSREYANLYPQYFRQIDKENGGHGSVWNMGVELAQGKYLRFLDSDDWLQNLDIFLKKLQQTDSDLILTSTRDVFEDEVWVQQIIDMEFYHSYNADEFDWLGTRMHNCLLHHCCTYKTSIFRQFMPGLFLEKQPYDDLVLWPAAMIGANSIEAFDVTLYNYLMQRDGQSISQEVQDKNKWAILNTEKHTIEFYEKHPTAPNSTKHKFIEKRLSTAYNHKYRQYLKLPYSASKKQTKEWDNWVRKTNAQRKSPWICTYRLFPYFIYYPMCNFAEWILNFKKRKNRGAGQYKKE